MQIAGKPIKVKLVVDLTKYDDRCVNGSLGVTIPNSYVGMWGNQSDRFVAVKFDNGARLDVLWSGLMMGEKYNIPAANK